MSEKKVRLDKDLLNKCKAHAMEKGYSSVEEFITHTLEKELNKNSGKPAMDEEIGKQLKGLGYIE